MVCGGEYVMKVEMSDAHVALRLVDRRMSWRAHRCFIFIITSSRGRYCATDGDQLMVGGVGREGEQQKKNSN